MGNVDTLWKVICGAVAKRGPDSGPGSLFWFVLMDYILFQAFRHYQHAEIERNLDRMVSFKQFQMERRRKVSYRCYLKKLEEELKPLALEAYFPGLRQQIDMMRSGQLAPVPSALVPPVQKQQHPRRLSQASQARHPASTTRS